MRLTKVEWGAFIRQQREAKNYKLRPFAKSVDISPTYLSRIEHGIADLPGAETIIRIAILLEVNSDVLLAMAGKIAPDIFAILVSNVPLQRHVRQLYAEGYFSTGNN